MLTNAILNGKQEEKRGKEAKKQRLNETSWYSNI